MQRRKFLSTAALSMPVLAFASKNLPTTTKAARMGKGFVVKSNQSRFGEQTKLGGKSPNDIKVSSKDTDGDLTIFEYTGNEKGGPPLHIHPKQDEIFFIMSGTFLFKVGDDQHTLTTGDTIFLPRNVPHTWAQLTDQGKMYFQFQPSGKMEDFFRVLGSLKGAPSPEQGAKIFADHDMQVVGPPLAF
jgi:quercetin dioxygenase-like cupin family protein